MIMYLLSRHIYSHGACVLTGLAVACWLLFDGVAKTPQEAIRLFEKTRTPSNNAVEPGHAHSISSDDGERNVHSTSPLLTPTAVRFVHYFAEVLTANGWYVH